MLRWFQRSSLRVCTRCIPSPNRATCWRSRAHLRPLGFVIQIDHRQRRAFSAIPSVLVPPVIFVGLAIGLWTWKCCMMVLFQNKIIYMPGLPPNARWEAIADYKGQCGRVEWREERIRSGDGTRISLCLASVDSGVHNRGKLHRVYILYFQGNASSLPPRLPFLSPVLRVLRDRPVEGTHHVRYTMICCSYRGYWTSKGRPSEKGIAMDAAAALQWIKSDHHLQTGNQDQQIPVIIWGQSIGAGVATNLAATADLSSSNLALETLILETPFLSIRAMLETLYPQKWLPYRHLWPFLRNHLDSWTALEKLSARSKASELKAPKVLLLEAGKDELVPQPHGDMLKARCLEVGLDVKRTIIHSALHNEVMVRPGGLSAVVEAVQEVARETRPNEAFKV